LTAAPSDHGKAVAAGFLGWMLDAFDFFLVVFCLTAIGKEFSQAVKENPQVPITHGSLEGYISAKVLVEGLRRAGPQLTRVKLISTLESMTNYDVGGMTISYSPEDHQGSSFVELTVINRDGKFVR